MIRHDFGCTYCKFEALDEPISPQEVDQKLCPACGGLMEIVWRPKSYKPFPAFTTTNVDGKPREITSLQQIRKLERESGKRNLVWEPGSYNNLKYGDL